VPKGRTKPRDKNWTLEQVRCVTASDILQDFASSDKFRNSNTKLKEVNNQGQTIIRKRRPHVLKIDVEGHDHEVLMSFVNLNTPAAELPLLIEFEAKSIGKHFPAAKAELEKIGYVVSDFAADGFAMLKDWKILEGL
jgi:hypothetical protein